MTEYYIQDETEGLNKRIDDAFTELDTQRNRISGLTGENSELKREIIRLTDEVHNLRIFLGLFSIIAVGICYDELKEIHKKYFGQWRFGQLIVNVLADWQAKTKRDIFFPEEDEMIQIFRDYVNKEREDE